MRRISAKEAREYIPLKENYSDKSLEAAEYFTLTPSKSKEGWENITYYTARKRSLYAKRGKGDRVEGEVHHALKKYRVNNQREFFSIELEEAKKTIELIGKNYIG